MSSTAAPPDAYQHSLRDFVAAFAALFELGAEAPGIFCEGGALFAMPSEPIEQTCRREAKQE